MNTIGNPEHQALSHVADFVSRKDKKRKLLIVYYAGHGYSKVDDAGRIQLAGLV